MRLYTVCAHGRPVLVISAGTEDPMEDRFTTDPEIMNAHRFTQALSDNIPSEVASFSECGEIEEALDTWMGEDLQALKSGGRPLWNGDRTQVSIREATTDEAAKWHISWRDVIDAGDQDAGDESWAVYLVSRLSE
jgi:hypothetical protein